MKKESNFELVPSGEEPVYSLLPEETREALAFSRHNYLAQRQEWFDRSVHSRYPDKHLIVTSRNNYLNVFAQTIPHLDVIDYPALIHASNKLFYAEQDKAFTNMNFLLENLYLSHGNIMQKIGRRVLSHLGINQFQFEFDQANEDSAVQALYQAPKNLHELQSSLKETLYGAISLQEIEIVECAQKITGQKNPGIRILDLI